MRKLAGTPLTPYSFPASLFHPFISDTCNQGMPSFAMASFHFPLLSSRDTDSTWKPLSLYNWYAFTTFGFSARQGPHQLAQKSTNTYLPRREERVMGLPSTSFC